MAHPPESSKISSSEEESNWSPYDSAPPSSVLSAAPSSPRSHPYRSRLLSDATSAQSPQAKLRSPQRPAPQSPEKNVVPRVIVSGSPDLSQESHTHSQSQSETHNHNHYHSESQSRDEVLNQNQNQSQEQKQQSQSVPPQLTRQLQKRTPSQFQQKSSNRKSLKYCKKCGERLTGQFVRALGDVYHVACFCCHVCGQECASKFFSSEAIDPETGKEIKVALCEQDYFRKLDLVCFKCQQALRGPYVTALNRKYHLEHFTCSICDKVFGKDESFYEHDSDIYCHFHYSKLYASHCEGCHAPILKQYAEIFRGGRIQQWHPECFMVHKFWSITVTLEYAGLSLNLSKFITADGSLKEIPDSDLAPLDLFELEQKMEQAIMSIWLTFSAYEEATAACISNMLQFASTGQQLKGLLTTGRLIFLVETLFNGINALHLLGVENLEIADSKYQNLRKEPRSLSAKIMTYMAILRKSNNTKAGRSPLQHSKELLSLITGLAHYLKLIIRYGLYHALQHNKFSHSSMALERFSREVRRHEEIPEDVFPNLKVPATSTDSCSVCKKSIEQECVLFNNNRWHLDCLRCATCGKNFTKSTILDASYDSEQQVVYCAECTTSNSLERGFENISRFTQLIYLLKIALIRSRVIMERDIHSGRVKIDSSTEQQTNQATELRYKQTLTDIKRMRSTRRDQKLSTPLKQEARRSRIIEAPDLDHAEESDLFLDDENNISRNLSFLHSNVEGQLEQRKKKKLIVEDEPNTSTTDLVYLDRTTDLLKNQKSLTLDDIPRIVSLEEAREQRPNAFRHLTHSDTTIDPKPRSMKLAARSNTVGTSDTPQHPNNQNSPSYQLQELHKDQNSGPITKLTYYSELTTSQHFVLRHIAVLSLMKIDPKYQREELLSLIPTKKASTFWGRIFKSSDNVHTTSSASNSNPNGSASSRKSSLSQGSGVFGTPLEDLTARYGVDSDLGVGPAKLKVPLLVDDCISAMHQMDMSVEGVFRKNGNIKGLRILTESIDANPTALPDFTKETPIQLAALLKKFLRELPDPLLTFKLYDLWISSQKHQDPNLKYRILKICNCMLPSAHRDFAEVLLYFLRWVTSFAYIDKDTGSKMHTHNLATVITPNILYSNPGNTTGKTAGSNMDLIPGGELYLLAIEVLDTLLQTPEDFAVVPKFIKDFYDQAGFQKDEDLTTKEIMLKCDLFLRKSPKFFESAFEKDLKYTSEDGLDPVAD